MSLSRLAAELSDLLQNSKRCLEVEPSKARWRERDRGTVGGMGLEEGSMGENTAVWQR